MVELCAFQEAIVVKGATRCLLFINFTQKDQESYFVMKALIPIIVQIQVKGRVHIMQVLIPLNQREV